MNVFNKASFAIIVLLAPGIAQANTGVPMLVLLAPYFLISLVPIIALESLYLSRRLALTSDESVKTVSIANVVSTILGIPITWLLLVLIQIVTGGAAAYGIDSALGKALAVTWQAPWLIPYEEELNWMVPIASLVLMVPFFFTSWWSEYFVANRLLKNRSSSDIKTTVRNANLISYFFLMLWIVGHSLANSGSAS